MFLVLGVLNGQRTLEHGGDFHIIISVDAENVLNHVAGPAYVHTIGGHCELQSLIILSVNLHLKARDDALDGVVAELLSDKAVAIFVLQAHFEVGKRIGIDILNLHADLSAGEFLAEYGSLL